jgi:vacuolar-type H+-ATPase subunit C/Vma6
LALCGEKEGRNEAEYWLPGGHRIPLVLFKAAIATRDPVAAGACLASGFKGTRLAPVFSDGGGNLGGLERAVLAALITAMRDGARTAPLSVAPLLGYALRLRAEALDVRWLIWGISLGAPGATLVEGLVTAP